MRLLLLIVALLFSACSSKNPSTTHTVSLQRYQKTPESEAPNYRLKTEDPIALSLLDEYKKWKGTPYCYGGDSHDGVDCSAFVQRAYMDAFRVRVPRTTKQQAKTGYQVSRKNTQAGDMLLFKTGIRGRHSGIYLEQGNFIHASTKHGVSIANLNNPYWKSTYWQTRRVLP